MVRNQNHRKQPSSKESPASLRPSPTLEFHALLLLSAECLTSPVPCQWHGKTWLFHDDGISGFNARLPPYVSSFTDHL